MHSKSDIGQKTWVFPAGAGKGLGFPAGDGFGPGFPAAAGFGGRLRGPVSGAGFGAPEPDFSYIPAWVAIEPPGFSASPQTPWRPLKKDPRSAVGKKEAVDPKQFSD